MSSAAAVGALAPPRGAPRVLGVARDRRGSRRAVAARASSSDASSSSSSSTTRSSSPTAPSPGTPRVATSRRDVLALAATALLASKTLVAPSSSTASVTASSAFVDTPEIRAALREALVANVVKTKAPAVLRLVFHDAGTYRVASNDGGMNGSVKYELSRPESFGLKRGLGPVLATMDALRDTPAAAASLADVIAAAGAYAVELTGGPIIRVRLGRVDAVSADPENRMPAETLTGEEQRAHFARAGFSTREMVAIAGAHTIGGKGFGEPYVFDNEYYKTLLARPWADATKSKEELDMASHIGLTSDKNLATDAPSLEYIRAYAEDQRLFFEDFSAAYLKLTEQGATWR